QGSRSTYNYIIKTGGQFAAKNGGQFGAKSGGQFTAKKGGHITRNLHPTIYKEIVSLSFENFT
ncbi:MAG: hypothetical protein ACK5WF_20530, partial [Cyclobacteriaceae bacterium]